MSKILNRVALEGPHGSGKSTLLGKLGARLDLPMLSDSLPTRVAKHMGYQKAADVLPRDVEMFQWLSLLEQYAEESVTPRFLATRSVIAYSAYARYRLPSIDECYHQVAATLARRYDAIIVLPPNSNPALVVDNNQRFTEGVEEINEHMRMFIIDNGLPTSQVITLQSDTPEDRMVEALQALAGRGWAV